MRRALMVIAALTTILAGCGAGGTDGPGTVAVLYAGSLTNVMENGVDAGFGKATGGDIAGQAGGSAKLAADISGEVKRGDVFISASPKVNQTLQGRWESWNATFATAPLLIAYNPRSRFADALRHEPWQQVINRPGFRMGTTDPALDPKGKLAAQAMRQAGVDPGRVAVFPEESLLGRLQSGQLDAGFFYSIEARQAKLPTVPLPGMNLHATYTITVLRNPPNPRGAAAFVEYLLGADGRALLREHGFQLVPVSVTGNVAAVPDGLRAMLALR